MSKNSQNLAEKELYYMAFTSTGLHGYFERRIDELCYQTETFTNFEKCRKFISKELFKKLSDKLDEFLTNHNMSLSYSYNAKHAGLYKELTLIFSFDFDEMYYNEGVSWEMQCLIREELNRITANNVYWGLDKQGKVF
jgi:hypothetical protein